MISIVIPAYNEEKVIAQTLAAVAELCSPEPWEVIIVDNASTDRTVELAKRWEDKMALRIVRESKKVGVRRGLRVSPKRAGGSFYQPMRTLKPPPDWIEKMLIPFAGVGCGGGSLPTLH